MPLWPLIRVPTFVSATVVVFCMAVVADTARANHVAGSYLTTHQSGCWQWPSHVTDTDDWRRRDEAMEHCRFLGQRIGQVVTQTDTVETLLGNSNNNTDGIEVRLDQVRDRVTGDSAPPGSGKSLADLNTRLVDVAAHVDALEGNTDGIESKLDQLHDDVLALTAAVETQGTDLNPAHIKLASSETQVEEAANAGTGALWFLAGLLVVVCVAGAIRNAVMPK